MKKTAVAPTNAPASATPEVAWWQAPSPALSSLVVFVLALAVFANTFGHGFVWDDSVLLDQKARFYRTWLDAWREPPGLPNMRMYRPLEMMTLWIDSRLWSSSSGYHVTQVLLHAVNGVLVLLLMRALGALPWAAIAGAALFVVHPVQVESVAWLTCRADIMTATFATSATLAFVRHQAAPIWWTTPVILAAAFLATASKETGSVTPLLLIVAALVLPMPAGGTAARLRRAAPTLAASVVGVALCQLLRPADVTTGVGRAPLALSDVVNLAGAFSYQLARVLGPIDFAPFVPTTPTDTAHLLLAAAGGTALLAAFALAPVGTTGMLRFGIAWFAIAVAPAVAVVLADFSATPVAERRLYLGMVGVAIITATVLSSTRWSRSRGAAAVVAAILALLAVVTIIRNAHWKNELTLWTAVTERLDSEPLPYLNLGLALADAGRPAEAEAAYRRGLALRPNDVNRQRLSINLGLIVVEQGKLDEAQTLFTTANEIGGHAIAYRGLALVARKRGQAAARTGDTATANAELTRALANANQALAINPRYHQGHATLAGILYDAGRYRDALASYQRAAALAGDTPGGRQAAAAAQELSTWLAAHPEAP